MVLGCKVFYTGLEEWSQPISIELTHASETSKTGVPPQFPYSLCSFATNWSNFKPEFSGKPEEDVEAHLLCSNDWMNAHHFVNGVKVQRFCLTLLGEARLWFQSLESLNNVTRPELQNLFRQRYSKLGNA